LHGRHDRNGDTTVIDTGEHTPYMDEEKKKKRRREEERHVGLTPLFRYEFFSSSFDVMPPCLMSRCSCISPLTIDDSSITVCLEYFPYFHGIEAATAF
jgi:hypothetical protein